MIKATRIVPTQQHLRELFDYDPRTGVVTRSLCTANRHTQGEIVGTKGARGYLQATVNSLKYPLHRLIWCWVHGTWPTDDIDHINRVRDDNRIENLRIATRSENNHNAGPNRANTSGHRGACWDKSKGLWAANIGVNGRTQFLGRYATAEEAGRAYLAAKLKYHPTAP